MSRKVWDKKEEDIRSLFRSERSTVFIKGCKTDFAYDM